MNSKFAKMHSLGNDFMVIDATKQDCTLNTEQITRLADRHTGIGFDQLLIVLPPSNPSVDFDYHIYNADGSESGQCGNGARCFMLFVTQQQLTTKSIVKVKTISRVMGLEMLDDGHIQVDLGHAHFEANRIPFVADVSAEQLKKGPYALSIESINYQLSILSVGNPHAVICAKQDLDTVPLSTWGPAIQNSPYFPQQVNLGVMQIIDNHTLKLRVYERGSGETLACGSGACAAAVAARLHYGLDETIKVILAGGELSIQYSIEENVISMTGSASYIFDGCITI